MADHEDDAAGRVQAGAGLAARAGAHHDLAGVSHSLGAAVDLARRRAELAHLAVPGGLVELVQLSPDGPVGLGFLLYPSLDWRP